MQLQSKFLILVCRGRLPTLDRDDQLTWRAARGGPLKDDMLLPLSLRLSAGGLAWS